MALYFNPVKMSSALKMSDLTPPWLMMLKTEIKKQKILS